MQKFIIVRFLCTDSEVAFCIFRILGLAYEVPCLSRILLTARPLVAQQEFIITSDTANHGFDTALSMASEQQQTMPNQQVDVGAPTNPAPSDIMFDRLGNANRIFLTKRKDRQSSSAAGSPPNAVKTEPGFCAVKTEPDFRAEALSSLQVYQPTHAGSQTSASRLYSPLFTPVNGDSPQESPTPTGSSAQGVSARLSTVRLASNMDFNCEFRLPRSSKEVCSCS